MLLLSSPPNGRQRRASLLLAVVLLFVFAVSASLPVPSKCPGYLGCARIGRKFCEPGSSQCGPCVRELVENDNGVCVKRSRRHQHGKVIFYPDSDEEIDYIHSVIEKQEVSESRPPKQPSKHPAAISYQTDVNKSKQRSQSRPSVEALQATTTAAPHLASSGLPNTSTSQPRLTVAGGRSGPLAVPTPKNDKLIVILISVFLVVGTVAVILATVCFVKVQKETRLAQKVDYPAYGGTVGPAATVNGTSMGDKTLAKSAQMFHYHHQKQQMLSMGNNQTEQKVPDTEVLSDEEEVGGDFTVYECPGLAPTGEMEVKNPLFDDSNLHYQGNQK
ncbi:uncharacterized protein V6R79_011505 [Siganus canaliculatus]